MFTSIQTEETRRSNNGAQRGTLEHYSIGYVGNVAARSETELEEIHCTSLCIQLHTAYETTKAAPFELMFERKPKLPIDTLFDIGTEQKYNNSLCIVISLTI